MEERPACKLLKEKYEELERYIDAEKSELARYEANLELTKERIINWTARLRDYKRAIGELDCELEDSEP